MAPRDSAAARSTVAENFGLTAADLGVSDTDGDGLQGFEGTEFDDGGGDFDGFEDDGGALERDGRFPQQREGGRDRGPDMGEGQRPMRRARDQYGRDPRGREQQQQQPPQQRQQQMPASAEVRPDGRGNLVDRSGQIVARAGKEARWYQAAATARQEATRAAAQVNAVRLDFGNRLQRAVQIGTELHNRLEQMNARDAEIKRLNITPNEQLEAMQLVAMSKTNPVQALRTLLTRAAANGIDLTQLGLQGAEGMKSVADMLRQEISKEMQPLRERSEVERQEQERTQARQQDLNNARVSVGNFFAQNPEARQFIPVFDAVLQRYPDTSLGELWARIQLNMARGGNRQTMEGGRTRRRGVPPQGRGFPPQREGRSKMASVATSYEQIARDVLSEAGVR